MNFEEVHHDWKSHHYEWLLMHKVPKSLGDQVEEDHLMKLEVNTTHAMPTVIL